MKKARSEWVEVPVDSIVDETLWDECNGIHSETGTKYQSHRGRKPVYLFAGVVHCGKCPPGKKLYRQTGWNKYRCYKCATKIAEDDLEVIFLEQLSGFLLSEERVDALMSKSREEALRRQNLAGGLRKDGIAMGKQADALVELYQKGGLDVEEFKTRHIPIRERLREIEKELSRIEKEASALEADSVAKERALSDGAGLSERWPTLAAERKRKVVESLVEKITVSGDEVEFDLNYIPGSLVVNSEHNRRDSWRRRA